MAESDKDMNERILNEIFEDFDEKIRIRNDRHGRHAFDISVTSPTSEWVIQPKHPVGFQLLRVRGNREPGPRLEFTVRLTLGRREASPEEAQEMLETIKDMFQETFVASVDFVNVEPLLSPQLRRPI